MRASGAQQQNKKKTSDTTKCRRLFFGSHRMNWYLVSYILACIMVGLTGCYLLINTGRSIGALTFLIGAIIVFVIFGLRWFKYGTNSLISSSWPPIINTCPDYLVFYERNTSADKKESTCIDTLGVSRKPEVLAKWPSEGTAPADDKYYFSLKWTKTGNDLLVEKCNRTIEAGLTWEGISNGESCYTWTRRGATGSELPGAGGCPTPAA